jgi:hypothetical protein
MTMRVSAAEITVQRPDRRYRPALANRFVLRLLHSRARPILGARMTALRYTARSGAVVMVPAQAARDRDRLVVRVGRPEGKRWWRQFINRAPTDVLVEGQWHAATAEAAADERAVQAYRDAFPHVAAADGATFVTVALDRPLPATPPLRGLPLVRAWFATVTIAEFVGFAVPACVGALTVSTRPAASLPALLASGAVEGGLLGSGQVAVLRRALPEVPGRRWIAATAGAAVLAYAIGLAPSAFAIDAWPVPLAIVYAAIGGGLLLASIGTAQWLILRRHVAHAVHWIWATALAWAMGLGAFLVFTMPLWQPGQPLSLIVAIGLGGGLLMAATTSLITGVTLRRLLR